MKNYTMTKRVNLSKVSAAAYNKVYALDLELQNSDLSKTHFELIKIRSSQINGCAFCLNMHTKDALAQGETAQRIFLLNAWRETALFTEEERVILEITEEVTLISHGGLSDETYSKAIELFSEEYLGLILMAVVTINAWNRIAISTNLPV